MTKRSILNTSSKKKRDTMVSYTNQELGTDVGSTTYRIGPAFLRGGTTYMFPWIATARPGVYDTAGQPATAIDQSCRTASRCYMKGVKEKIQVQTSDGTAWQWRRVCFTLKGPYIYTQERENLRYSLLTSQGMVRVVNGAQTLSIFNTLQELMFQGKAGVDYLSPFTAKMDNDRVTTKYDKTFRLQSGNASGQMRNFNMWHPMNKNLMFDDDENGGGMDLGRYSTYAKQGMGDYYIVDIIAAGSGSLGSQFMSFEPSSTLYWHEK